MRFLPLALLGLMLTTAPTLMAQAADRPGGGQGRTQVQGAGKATAAQRPAAQRSSQAAQQRPAARRTPQRAPQGAVQRSAPVRSQLGVTRDSRAASSATACSPRQGSANCGTPQTSWTRGLPPAAGIQANECPHGTMATLARGHDDIIRCMPI